MDYLDLLKRNFLIACQLDVQTLKPGNVSFNSSGFGMTGQDFINSSNCLCTIIGAAGVKTWRKNIFSNKRER